VNAARPAAEIAPCRPPAWPEALAVLYRRVPRSLRPTLIAQAQAEARSGQLDLSNLWVARRRGRIVGAILAQRLPGRAAALWPPELVLTWNRPALAAALVHAAVEALRQSGVRIVQALLDETVPRRAAADLARGGLPPVTELAYLSRQTAPPLPTLAAAPPWQWVGYDPARADEFRAVLAATHVGSLDMPELEGARSLDDLLAAHSAAGRFDPTRWQLGRLPGEPDAAALLLLAPAPEREAWEVAYLGLTPAARGRGLGRAAMAHALDLARPHIPRLELAVDVRNIPAMKLYRATGFHEHDRRAVHLRVFAP
jgi:ribosomal protein S18 acetylase RimI-like enzyme